MRFSTVVLLTGATAASATSTATLLLPGFEGHDLQASVLDKDADATTYLVSCPTSVASSACGIPGNGLTAISASTSAQLIQVAGGKTASVSCNVAGTTYASCSVEYGTAHAHQTLTGTDLNWMPVTISTSTTPTPTSTSTSTPSPTSTSTTVTPTSTRTPTHSSTPTSSPKKSPTKSTSRATSTPMVTSAPAGPTGSSPAPTTGGAPAASSTPAHAGAGSVARNGWVLGGALAMVYALV
ncbi:hypothetical protein N7456_008350 [Penicillium angulare]|uniref:Uncharacterized protein n=1 Tax=Penicillium angulare TaxID=116970 RepID=A0A9W9FCH0_9EURO|nr:hypothetical protein N7456_008350 [Penicillium angulare]